MHLPHALLLGAATLTAAAPWNSPGSPPNPGSSSAKPSPKSVLKSFDNLVAFGDSYTDESRLNYFIAHNGTAPPLGQLAATSNQTAGGGTTWSRFAATFSGAKLFDYAVGGAVCTNSMIYRYLASLNGPFPSLTEYEIPTFQKEATTTDLYGPNGSNRRADNTVYSFWIGTNDLGVNALLTDSQKPGTNLSTFVECVFSAMDGVYASGGRYFVLFNEAPLQLSPLYGMPDVGGLAVSHYWPDKPSNTTEISQKMLEYTVAANALFSYMVPYDLLLANRYPGAEIVLFDVHSLLTDIYYNPGAYLKAPANATGFVHQCDITGTTCTDVGDIDAYMWYDELHPSQGTDRVIAEEFVKVVGGSSKYATYWKS